MGVGYEVRVQGARCECSINDICVALPNTMAHAHAAHLASRKLRGARQQWNVSYAWIYMRPSLLLRPRCTDFASQRSIKINSDTTTEHEQMKKKMKSLHLLSSFISNNNLNRCHLIILYYKLTRSLAPPLLLRARTMHVNVSSVASRSK